MATLDRTGFIKTLEQKIRSVQDEINESKHEETLEIVWHRQSLRRELRHLCNKHLCVIATDNYRNGRIIKMTQNEKISG